MHLPIVGDDSANIDKPEATRMLHYAVDRGVNRALYHLTQKALATDEGFCTP